MFKYMYINFMHKHELFNNIKKNTENKNILYMYMYLFYTCDRVQQNSYFYTHD